MSENENKNVVTEQVSEENQQTVNENVSNEDTVQNSDSLNYSYTQPDNDQPSNAEAKPLPPENMVAGIVGALLFSLIGAIVYFVIYQFGYIAGICGLITVVCAIKGYTLFGKRESLKGIIIAVVISVVALLAAEYVSISYAIYDSFKELYAAGEIDYTITISEAILGSFEFILATPELLSAVIKDVAIMLVLSAVGAFTSIKNAIISAKVNNASNQ